MRPQLCTKHPENAGAARPYSNALNVFHWDLTRSEKYSGPARALLGAVCGKAFRRPHHYRILLLFTWRIDPGPNALHGAP